MLSQKKGRILCPFWLTLSWDKYLSKIQSGSTPTDFAGQTSFLFVESQSIKISNEMA